MRHVLWLLLLVVGSGCGRSLDDESVKIFHQAQQTFDEAESPTDFLIAADLFQKLIDDGIESGAIYFNQGNAFHRAGEKGRAIAAYRRAQRYMPRYVPLQLNLQTSGARPHPNSKQPVDYIFFWQDSISYPRKFQLSLGCASVTFCLGLLAIVRRSSTWLRVAAVLLLPTALLCCSAGLDWYRYEYLRHGVVTASEVVARKGPSSTYEAAFTQSLSEGTEFLIRDQRSDWLLIELPTGDQGWLPHSDVIEY